MSKKTKRTRPHHAKDQSALYTQIDECESTSGSLLDTRKQFQNLSGAKTHRPEADERDGPVMGDWEDAFVNVQGEATRHNVGKQAGLCLEND
jgi:hypothetical protein